MTLKVEIDWDRSGFGTSSGTAEYSDVYTDEYSGTNGDDVTDRVRPQSGTINLEYGRDQSTALAPTVAGRGSMVLDNADRALSPRNPASPFYGYLKPARPVRILRTWTDSLTLPFLLDEGAILGNEVTQTLFFGHTDDNPINPELESKKATISLVDNLANFRGLNISTPLYSGIRTGEVISRILDATDWPDELRDLDAGATIFPWWWVDSQDALTALEDALRSEGPPALLTVGTSGEIIFRDRHHRLVSGSSLTSQSTWRSSGTVEPIMNKPFSYDEAWRNIVNTGSVSVDVRRPGALQDVWSTDDSIVLTDGEHRRIVASTSDPFYGAVTPQEGIDFTVLSGVVTVTLTRDSGASTGIMLTASGDTVVGGLKLRAYPVSVSHSVQVDVSDVSSIEDYGPRSFPADLPWCNEFDAESVLTAAVVQRSQPKPILSARFVLGGNANRLSGLLTRNLSDRVTIIEPETVLNDDFFIENIQHELTGEHDHAITFGLEMAPILPSPVFQLDTAGAGADDGLLGDGFDDPATLFILDSTNVGHRLDEGMLAT